MSRPIDFAEIRDRLNRDAVALCQKYLPNGRREGNHWVAGNIFDTGKGGSLRVNLPPASYPGKWRDFGNAPGGEDRGDMLDLIRIHKGLYDMGDVVAEAKAWLGIEDVFVPGRRMSDEERNRLTAEAAERQREAEEERAAERDRKAGGAKALWLSGQAMAGSPAEAYLIGRGLRALPHGWPGSLHWHPEVWHGKLKAKLPAMLACALDAQGRHRATHRTFLERCPYRGWTKLGGSDAKMVVGPIAGAFVPINKGASGKSMRAASAEEPFYITEGIEDAIVVAMHRPHLRVIAAYSLANLGEIAFPAPPQGGGRRLVLVADRDSNERAQEQLERSIARQQARGHVVETVFPPEPFKDMNDWWLAELAQQDDIASGRITGGRAA